MSSFVIWSFQNPHRRPTRALGGRQIVLTSHCARTLAVAHFAPSDSEGRAGWAFRSSPSHPACPCLALPAQRHCPAGETRWPRLDAAVERVRNRGSSIVPEMVSRRWHPTATSYPPNTARASEVPAESVEGSVLVHNGVNVGDRTRDTARVTIAKRGADGAMRRQGVVERSAAPSGTRRT
jgi:hypothetical protein